MDELDVMVVGAGVIGLAAARAIAQSGHEVVVLERNARIAQETSSRNSGVIHSGIYYAVGSMKAKFCVRGASLLYDYCASRGISHQQVGKIVVAQHDQIDALAALQANGVANGVTNLQLLTAEEVRKREPLVSCAAALFSPATGIIDVHEYVMSLWADLEQAQGQVVFGCELVQVTADDRGLIVTVKDRDALARWRCKWLINAAGLHAVQLLTKIANYPPRLHKVQYLAKGSYFSCRGDKPFSHLIYPMPSEAGLGIHATLDLDGSTRFGPDVEWVNEIEYAVDAQRMQFFYQAIRQYWPTIPPESLQPAYAGIRPKLVGARAGAADFLIEDESVHSVPGLINLCGIESPGLTSSLAIAEYVSNKL